MDIEIMHMDEVPLDEEIPFWLALTRAPGLGSERLGRLLDIAGKVKAIFDIPPDVLRQGQIPPKLVDYLTNPDWQAVERDLLWLENANHHFITVNRAAYPPLLQHICDPPIALYVIGNINVLQTVQIGIVGSRNPSPDGRRMARRFSAALASQQFTITSGLALGVDSESHQGTLQSEGRTIAVLGNGLASIYPRRNRELAQQIIENGALVSELPLDSKPLPMNFPRRNRIISGMSTGVLVVEAAIKSGSLITARLAMEQGREVFAIPGSIYNPMSRGCHQLIRDGAKLVEQIQDITDEIGALSTLVQQTELSLKSTQVSTNGLDANAKVLLDNIGYHPISNEELLITTGISVSDVSRSLVELELKGLIESLPGGRSVRKS